MGYVRNYQSRTVSHARTAGAASASMLPGNPRRRALVVSAPTAGRVSIAFGGDATLDAGVTIHGGQASFTFCWENWREGLTDEVFIIADAGGRNIGLAESVEAVPQGEPL